MIFIKDFIFLQLVKNKDVTHFKFVVKLIIIKFAMVADLAVGSRIIMKENFYIKFLKVH